MNKHLLNEYQIATLEKKIALNFDEELFSSNDNKVKLDKSVIRNLNVLIEDSLNNGIFFYKIDLLEEIHKLETVCKEVEDTILFCMNKISMIECMYIVIEKNSISNIGDKLGRKKNCTKGTFNIQCILATRRLSNANMLSSIRAIFNELNEDIEVTFLNNYDVIKENWLRILEEKNYKFHRFVYFSKFYHHLYGSLAELEVTFYPECGYDLSFFEKALDSDIKGISGIKNSNEKICLNLINIFLHQNNLILLHNDIYIRIEQSTYGYRFWNHLSYLDLNNVVIFNGLKNKYKDQLNNFDVQEFLINCWEKFFEKFLKKKKNYFNDLIYDGNIIEFNDGLYFWDKKNFISFEKNKLYFFNKPKLGCYKYFNKSFEKLNPVKWLSFLNEHLGLEKENFISNLSIYLNSRINVNNQTIFLLGNSSYLGLPLIVEFSIHNYGESRDLSDLFFFEQYEDQKQIVCSYYNNSLLKTERLYNNMSLTERRKLLLNRVPILFKLKSSLNNKMMCDKVFILKSILFTLTFGWFDRNLLLEKILEEELAEILVFCANSAIAEKNYIN